MFECINNSRKKENNKFPKLFKSLTQTNLHKINLMETSNKKPILLKTRAKSTANTATKTKYFLYRQISTHELREIDRLASSKSRSNFLDKLKGLNKSEFERNNELAIEQLEILKARFRLAVRKLCIILKLCSEVRKNSVAKLNREISIYKFLHEKNANTKLVFNKSEFYTSNEHTLSEDTKKILRLGIVQRNDDQLRYALASINHSVPEFSNYPHNLQKLIVKYSTYEEYDSERVILREGHPPMFFYYVLSGTLMATVMTKDSITDEQVNRTVTFLKRGDMFGELALIKNTKRNASIISHTKISLLSIHKSYFFSVLTAFSNPNENIEFLIDKVPLLLKCGYPVDKFKYFPEGTLNDVYLRKDVLINDTNEWLYVVKTGSCKIIKSIIVNTKERVKYKQDKYKRQLKYLKVEELNNHYSKGLSIFHIKKFNFNKEIDKNDTNDDCVHLEIECLNEGDIFGIRDLIFPEYNQISIVSDGVACIRINKNSFKRYLNENIRQQFRDFLIPYPTNDELIKKYLDTFNWILYRKSSFSETYENIRLNTFNRANLLK